MPTTFAFQRNTFQGKYVPDAVWKQDSWFLESEGVPGRPAVYPAALHAVKTCRRDANKLYNRPPSPQLQARVVSRKQMTVLLPWSEGQQSPRAASQGAALTSSHHGGIYRLTPPQEP